MAVLALVFGLLALFLLGILFGPVAIVLGALAGSRGSKQPVVELARHSNGDASRLKRPLRGPHRCVSVGIHPVFLPHAPCQRAPHRSRCSRQFHHRLLKWAGGGWSSASPRSLSRWPPADRHGFVRGPRRARRVTGGGSEENPAQSAGPGLWSRAPRGANVWKSDPMQGRRAAEPGRNDGRTRLRHRPRLPRLDQHHPRGDPLPPLRLRRRACRPAGHSADHRGGPPGHHPDRPGGVRDRDEPPGRRRRRLLHHQPLLRHPDRRGDRHRPLPVAGDLGRVLPRRVRGGVPPGVRVDRIRLVHRRGPTVREPPRHPGAGGAGPDEGRGSRGPGAMGGLPDSGGLHHRLPAGLALRGRGNGDCPADRRTRTVSRWSSRSSSPPSPG